MMNDAESLLDEAQDAPQTRSAVAERWPQWAADFKPLDADRHTGLLARFLERLTVLARPLADGETIVDLSTERVEQIRLELLRIGRNLNEHRRLARWLDNVIEAGNQTKRWQVTFPKSKAALPPVQPVFAHRDFQLLAPYREIEASFMSLIAKGTVAPEDLELAWLLSSVLFGGIVSADRLQALIATQESRPIRSAEGLVWVALELEAGTKRSRTVTWYPDALTAALIARTESTSITKQGLLGLSDRHPLQDVAWDKLVTHLLELLGLPAWRHTTSDFLRAAEVSARLELPGFEASYLAGDYVCHSLPAQVQARLAAWKIEVPLPSEPETRPKSKYDLQGFKTTADRNASLTSQLAILSSARKALRGRKESIGDLDELQAANAGKLWIITNALLEWTKWLLGRKGEERRPLERNTAITYLDILGRRLLMIVEDDDVFDYEPEDFETLYELAADYVPTDAQRGRFWGRIRLFHDFLFLCGAPDLDLRELDGYVSSAGHRVSANLIGEREFDRFKTLLVERIAATGSRELTMILLAGICGYRLGLRRRETQMIHLRDIHPGPQPYLLVRPSRLASLKTYSATRQLPLAVLLTADELQFFNNFVADRLDQDGGSGGLLFADVGAPQTPLAVERLFDPITALFNAICGAESGPFRFHHLRHSFANWLLIALLASDERELIAGRPAFIDSDMLKPDQLRRIRDGLFPRLAGTEDPPGRRHLYQVAALMGHLSPETTLKCYLHLVDWIAGRRLDLALQRFIKSWSHTNLGAVCGLSHAMAYRPPYSNHEDDPLGFLRRFAKNRLPRSIETQADPKAGPANLGDVLDHLRPDEIPTVLTVMTVLQRYYAGAEPDWLSRVFSIPRSAIDAAIKTYERFYATRSTPSSKKSFRPPYEPKIRADRDEFWRIVEACEHSFNDPRNRPAMAAAVDALVCREGPRTGNVPFGKSFPRAEAVAKGLLCMGLGTAAMTFIVSKHAKGLVSSRPNEAVIQAVSRLGVETQIEIEGWPRRIVREAHIRLVFDVFRKTARKAQVWWRGRAAGVNFGAVWVAAALAASHQPLANAMKAREIT